MKKQLQLFFFVFMVASFASFSQSKYWTNIETSNLKGTHNLENFNKNQIKTFSLNLEAFKQALSGAPMRSVTSARSNTIISFPDQNGKFHDYRVVELPILSPELSLEFPNIKAYLGFDLNNPANRIRFSVTPQGVQTMATSANSDLTFVVPLDKFGSNQYMAYSRASKINAVKEFECLTENEMVNTQSQGGSTMGRDANDQILRTFRIAISTTGEYTNFWDDGNPGNGNAQEDALAQVVATLNRSNEVFEVDMAVTFQLVSGISIIYPNAATDPYTGNLNAQLQTTLTNNIGEANYDIGHLFTFAANNGNAGCIGCVCVNGQKGSAFSAHSFQDNDGGPYQNDFFDIDYVPHEIGHQMGATHTFSFSSEGAGVNVEPGSGTTIMGYAGITGPNDVQDHSDPYFHYHSINQILNNLNSRTCWTSTAITNNPPIANAGNNQTIPAGTAFVLRGTGTDPDGDILTYTWEQIDNGVTTTGNFGPTKTTGALFRSRPPSTDSNRYMPQLSRVIAGQLTETNPLESVDNSTWETITTVGRTFNFALTVRDRSEANGTGQFPQSSFDTMTVTVDGSSGPFVVTSQSTNETWDVGSSQEITWDVAGTNGGAVNTPTVNILLSVDGGQTFPFTLASNVVNDGAQNITVPNIGADTNQARVIVEGNNNLFFAVNSSNFSIQSSEFVLNVTNASVDICKPNDAVYTFTYNTFLGFSGTTNFSANNLPAGATASFNPPTATADGTNVTVTVSNTGSLAVDSYSFDLVGTSGSITQSSEIILNVFDANFAALTLDTPVNGANDVPADNALFEWIADPNAVSYEIDISTDAGFTNLVESATVTNTTYTSTTLNITTQYWWRVRAVNDCGNGIYSSASFTTANISCQAFNSSDTPLGIPDNNATGINSIINIPTTSLITDVNVSINITHTFVGDLILKLISPTGTEVILSDGNGGNGDNYTNTVFDDDAVDLIINGTAPFTGTFQPEGSLSLFNGEFSGGNWILNVSDNASFDVGNITSWSLEICGSPQTDTDGDGIPDNIDNCPSTFNPDQADIDGDGIGDACDDDIDGDGILNDNDNCPLTFNPDQADSNNNGIGDVCDVECDTASASDLPITITTAANVTYTSSIVVPFDFTITDVNVGIDITHTWNSDLLISLISPNNTTVVLSNRRGGSGDNYTNTVFDQEATTPIGSGAPPFTGTFIPDGDLTTIYNEMSAGTWTLQVQDLASGDGGTINAFNLEICGIPTLSLSEFTESNFNIYPNPNNGTFTIKMNAPNSDKINVSVYDIRGRQVYKNRFDANAQFENTIDLGTVDSGVYLVNINNGIQTITKKIIVK
ncbi:reprolysin-like metallopeptidase [Paucihalobacter sp.]|uniref:reprolysin-like metallopeptidase n=1 Tax=Paucihalobacter sp. TaxID=2850405 RepID=UPI003D160B8A